MILLQSCSDTKSDEDGLIPAIERYEGYFYDIIKKAEREGEFDPDIDLLILSAEFGVIDPFREIPEYDTRMTEERAEELRRSVTEELCDRIEQREQTVEVIVNGGKEYKRALTNLPEMPSVDCYHIPGEGIGIKGKKLKRVIRGDTEPVEPWDGSI